MSDLIEFVVTLKNREDLESFYTDMETEGGDLYIPSRSVSVASRRAISRNTHYMLTNEEADQLRQDSRVAAVMPAELERMAIRPFRDIISSFDKSTLASNSYTNWAILRCTEGSQRSNWGSDGTTNQSATVSFNETGKNVDVIIIDGHIDPAHPEYAVNADGTGGSRVNQLDWNTLSVAAGNIDNDGASVLSGTYVYTPYDDGATQRTDDNNHGAHVAGTACGNTQGWASDANIYNISPYSTNPNTLDSYIMWDYIRAFHANKSVNLETGRQNPTVCNCSYGSALAFDGTTFGKITRAIYRGVDTGVVSPNLSSAQLRANGIYDTIAESPLIPFYSTAIAADITDALNEGIIVVAAAGNEYFNVADSTDQDYNNTFYATYLGTNYFWYTHRGTTPAAVPGVICVGNVSQFLNETKRTSSNCGTRVDIYAPGSNILSSFNSTTSFGGTSDTRNASYAIGKISGTSMASPQVCGVLACVLETYPDMTPAEALEYLVTYSKKDQVGDTGGSTADLTSLQGSPNRYLFFVKERKTEGNVFPKLNYKPRPSSGLVYPRIRKTIG